MIQANLVNFWAASLLASGWPCTP